MIWGQRHLRYIKAERKALYTELLTTGRLNTYLADINEQEAEQMLLLTKQMAEREGVTEQLKAQDQMLWVQQMNNIRDRAMEIILQELFIHNLQRRGVIPGAYHFCVKQFNALYFVHIS